MPSPWRRTPAVSPPHARRPVSKVPRLRRHGAGLRGTRRRQTLCFPGLQNPCAKRRVLRHTHELQNLPSGRVFKLHPEQLGYVPGAFVDVPPSWLQGESRKQQLLHSPRWRQALQSRELQETPYVRRLLRRPRRRSQVPQMLDSSRIRAPLLSEARRKPPGIRGPGMCDARMQEICARQHRLLQALCRRVQM